MGRRKLSLMGSSEYEYQPELLDQHINDRKEFYRQVITPIIQQYVDKQDFKGAISH